MPAMAQNNTMAATIHTVDSGGRNTDRRVSCGMARGALEERPSLRSFRGMRAGIIMSRTMNA